MSTSNLPQDEANVNRVSIAKAMKILEITSTGAWQQAVKSHPYLKESIVKEVHPETDRLWTSISMDAVERYKTERKSHRNHTGYRKAVLWLAEDELEQAVEVLGEALDRDVEIEWASKPKAE